MEDINVGDIVYYKYPERHEYFVGKVTRIQDGYMGRREVWADWSNNINYLPSTIDECKRLIDVLNNGYMYLKDLKKFPFNKNKRIKSIF